MEFEVSYKQYGKRKYEVVNAPNQGAAIEKVKSLRIGANSFHAIKVNEDSETSDTSFKKTMDKAIRMCDDINSDKEKALAEYKLAKEEYLKVASKAKNLAEMKALGNTPEFKKFVEKKRVCMRLGCRI